jgi:hypothetical protein
MNNQLDIFGQFAYCNAIAFFVAAKNLVAAGSLVPPPLGTAIDGQPCPTTRDFFIVDQDQSDNVVTAYILSNGQVAQNTTTNFRNFPNSVILTNGSDNRLLVAVDQAIGCKPWAAPDASDITNGQNVLLPASGLNELHADHWQKAPIAYVPLNDPMAKSNNQPSLSKVNAYRQGVGQPTAASGADADQVNYCFNIYTTQPLRLLKLMGSLINYPSLDAAMADSLYTFLGTRFVASFSAQNLDCFDLLQIPLALPPIQLTLNGNGQTVGITITPPNNGAANPIYQMTTGAIQNVQAAAGTTTGKTGTTWTTSLIVGVAVGGGVGLLVIIGFIVAFRAHKVRNFFSGVRDGIATKMRD